MGQIRERLEALRTGSSSRRFSEYVHSRWGILSLGALILAIASLPRLFLPSWDIWPNGVDEGIDIMSGRMMFAGYGFYTQINTVHPPLVLSIYGVIDANPVVFRLFAIFASLVIFGFVLWAGYRIGNKPVMVASGAFLAMDMLFLVQSRLANLDMICLLWVVLGMASFVRFRQRGERWAGMLTGILLGIATMSKLFGTLAAIGVFAILSWDLLSDLEPLRRYRLGRFLPPKGDYRTGVPHLLLFGLSGILVILTVMALYGPWEVVQGIFLNQLNRPTDSILEKLKYFGVFLLLTGLAIPFVIPGVKDLYRRPEGILLLISLVYALFFALQSKTWVHHMIFLSPVVALTAGVGAIRMMRFIDRSRLSRARYVTRKAVNIAPVVLLVIAGIVSAGFSYAVKERGEPARDQVSDLVRELSDEGDYIISGDPMIGAQAERPVPPNVVNVAIVQYPPITSDELNRTVIDYGVELVVITYHLHDIQGFVDFVEENFILKVHIREDDLPLAMESNDYMVFILPEDSPLRALPEWGSLPEPEL